MTSSWGAQTQQNATKHEQCAYSLKYTVHTGNDQRCERLFKAHSKSDDAEPVFGGCASSGDIRAASGCGPRGGRSHSHETSSCPTHMHAQPSSFIHWSSTWIWLTVWRHDMDTLYTHYWLLVRGIDWLSVDFHHKVPVMHTLYCPFVLALVAPSLLYKPNSRWTVKWALYLTLMWRSPNECCPSLGFCTLSIHCRIFLRCGGDFTNILRGYFHGIAAIIRLPLCQLINPERYV